MGAEVPNGSGGGAELGRNAPSDRVIVALAARQHGIVTTAQLAGAGVGRRAIARRVGRGWLIPRFRGVYQVGPVAAHHAAEMAAVLVCGEGSALSHQSAAAIWGFAASDEAVHVSVTRDVRSRPGLRVHRTLSLNAVVRNGLPLTAPFRTLQDLSRVLTSQELDRAKEQAHVLGLVIPDDAGEPEFTRSEGENRLRTRQRFESDRQKDAALTVAGYRVIRITWRRLRYEPYSVTAQLGALLSVRPA